MAVEEVQNLCNRLESSVASSGSEVSARLQGELAARKKVRFFETILAGTCRDFFWTIRCRENGRISSSAREVFSI